MIVSLEHDGAAEARRALERCVAGGGVAVFPADGLYGLACDPSDAAAIARIHAIKGRDDGTPSAVMFFAPLAMRELISTLGPRTRETVAAALPGPVTLVVDNPGGLYPLACREDRARLGIRLIDGPLAGAASAIFQTSANRSGEPAPSRFSELDPGVIASADLALDGGDLAGLPSTVLDVTAIERGGEPTVLREGALSSEEARRLLEPARGW